MQINRSGRLSIALVLLALVLAVGAVLYAMGLVNFLTSDPRAAHHPTHAILLGILCLASLVGASFARPRTA